MGHKLKAHLHHLLLQVRDLDKYDSICFMLQDKAIKRAEEAENENR